jgi:hypothetical protein
MHPKYFLFFLLFGCWSNEKPMTTSINIKNGKDVKKTGNLAQSQEWVFEKVQGTKLLFKNGRAFDTHLFELAYIGQVSVLSKVPYLIFSGRDCSECDANISIYVHSPDDGELDVRRGQNRYLYSGMERDFETDSLLYHSRAFYGEVLNHTKGVIWYETRLLEDNSWGTDVFLLNVSTGTKKDTILTDTNQLKQTLQLLKEGKCKEIVGKKYTSEP